MPKTNKSKAREKVEKMGPKTVPSDFHTKQPGPHGAAKESKENGLPERLKKYQWQKGQSGNPKGGPRLKILSKAYKHMLAQIDADSGMTFAELIAYGQIMSAVYKGNTAAAKEIADRTEGSTPKTIKLEGETADGRTLADLSDDELDAVIAEAHREIEAKKKTKPSADSTTQGDCS